MLYGPELEFQGHCSVTHIEIEQHILNGLWQKTGRLIYGLIYKVVQI
jgi:hypothetical protein